MPTPLPRDDGHVDSAAFEFGTRRLDQVRNRFAEVQELAAEFKSDSTTQLTDRIDRIAESIGDFSANITVLGQVKAGKTALINTLIGQPGLLPSDVNPWTSVVTTIHLNKKTKKNVRAEFTFFDKDEWDGIVRGGGRLGELAYRAGADDELNEIIAQVEAVRSKAKARLGSNYELLLGQRHKYDHFDSSLIERYVCMGDPDDQTIQNQKQGQFADMTRSADLYIDLPQYPISLSIQDTPGVNDPFLIREQITLRSVEKASLCVVVLAAAQALNTVDLALLQLLSSMGRRQILIFVNRIDELDQPSVQVPQIRKALGRTLSAHGIEPAEIIFGSVIWAEGALRRRLQDLPDDCIDALESWAEINEVDRSQPVEEIAWQLSGIPDLQEAIGDQIAETTASVVLERARRNLQNVIAQMMANSPAGLAPANAVTVDADKVRERLAALRERMSDRLDAETSELVASAKRRIEAAAKAFVEATIAELMKHLERNRADGPWECDPMKLRILIRTTYLNFVKQYNAMAEAILGEARDCLTAISGEVLPAAVARFAIEAPQPPVVTPPTALGKTIVVDLKSHWWKRWLGVRSGPSAGVIREARDLLSAEIMGISDDVVAKQLIGSTEALKAIAMQFVDEQAEIILAMARREQATAAKGVPAATLEAERARQQRLAERLATISKRGREEEPAGPARNVLVFNHAV